MLSEGDDRKTEVASRKTEVGSRKSVTRYHCSVAWTGHHFEPDVVVSVENGLIEGVQTGPFEDGMISLKGVVFPGFVNNHSHVFHRLLRGHVAERRGDFWSWREAMYRVAAELDPDE